MAMSWKILKTYHGYLGKTTHKRKLVEVECGCGVIEIRRSDHVLSGRTKYCKRCSAKVTIDARPNHGWLTHNNQTLGLLSRTFFSTYRFGAIKRGIEFNITHEYAWELFKKQGGKCALTGWQLEMSAEINHHNPAYAKTTASLDRINNNVGYIEGNVQWLHKEINRFKNHYSTVDFISMCKAVVLHSKESN